MVQKQLTWLLLTAKAAAATTLLMLMNMQLSGILLGFNVVLYETLTF